MRERFLNRPMIVLAVAVISVSLTVSLTSRQEIVHSTEIHQTKQKKLIDRAIEQDVEVEGRSEAHTEYTSFDELVKDAVAIVHGRIIDSDSFFDPSGDPIEYGEVITTEYSIEVRRVIRDRTLNSPSAKANPRPSPLTTPLKIARNGGMVLVNRHRASVKVKGYENLEPGREYVFFLFWSPDYKAYVLAGGISGVVLVNDDMSLRALASSKEIEAKVKSLRLENLINQLN